ncbi:MAG: hypothetical protein ACK58T_49515 [Phycisphaerae bacterium]
MRCRGFTDGFGDSRARRVPYPERRCVYGLHGSCGRLLGLLTMLGERRRTEVEVCRTAFVVARRAAMRSLYPRGASTGALSP